MANEPAQKVFVLFGEVQYLHGLSFNCNIAASLNMSLLVRKHAFSAKRKVIDPTNSENDTENYSVFQMCCECRYQLVFPH